MEFIKYFFRKFLYKIFLKNLKYSFSQFGEDLIIKNYFDQKGILKPTYLDIGANEPKYISNTYLFYDKGSKGVLVEPNPKLAKKLKKQRSKDIVLNVGIGINQIDKADFYIFPDFANGLSTFSKEEADHWSNVGMKGVGKIKYEKVVQLPLVDINKIIEDNFNGSCPNFISIDVEGLDYDIIKSFNFEKYHPNVFCIETLKYNQNQESFKNQEIIQYMLLKEYSVYADTYVNTIFVKR